MVAPYTRFHIHRHHSDLLPAYYLYLVYAAVTCEQEGTIITSWRVLCKERLQNLNLLLDTHVEFTLLQYAAASEGSSTLLEETK